MSLLLLSALATAPDGRAALAADLRHRAPLVIGHRGACAHVPENTLASFRLALAAEADLVELDYHHSRDGVPVVIHDGTLDRTTNATNLWGGSKIPVLTKAAAEIAGLDAGSWYDARFSGIGVPTLVDAVQTIQASGTTLIERKGGDAATLVQLLRARGWMESVVVQSFDWAFVSAAHREAPDLVLGALGPPSSRNGRKLEDAEKVLSAAYIEEIAALGARFAVWNRQVDATGINAARERGLGVWVYTINDPAEAEALVRLGVEGIITDDPALIRARLRPAPDEAASTPIERAIPSALDDHPGNIFLEGDLVRVRLPEPLPAEADRWRFLDETGTPRAAGALPERRAGVAPAVEIGHPGVGWYRLEVGTGQRPDQAWTTAAVLPRLRAPTPGDSPVCVDTAASWFARDDVTKQGQFANLATLAGVNWVRDRLRWSELQPNPGALTTAQTTYDRAAEIHHRAGLRVLQVFHDTPRWARESETAGGRFAPDLRHVHTLARLLAERFQGRVQAWEPWNEANVATFGGHTVDQMCAWQKAAWLGFKAGDPSLIVGWNATAAVPTRPHTTGVLANQTWP